jgi:GWxTD domain-containing protein
MTAFLSILLFLTAAVVCTFAQSPKATPPLDPTEKPRKVTEEISNAHKKWLNEDVAPIITDAERDAFLKLKTNDERENFIAWFWSRRDPDPDTEENEFREEYYQRIAYANEHFASGMPGWKTDRGRIYIRWGKPDSVESHPTGGTYTKSTYEGGGSSTAYPYEVWFYRHLDGVGDGIEIEFVDRAGSGEYRIARDPGDKDALAANPGMNTATGSTFGRAFDSQLERQIQLNDLERPPAAKFPDLLKIASGDSGVVDNNALDFDLRVDYFRQSDDRVIAAFTLQTDNSDLQFKDSGGIQTATLNVLGRVTALTGKRSGIFEDSVTTTSTAAELAALKQGKSVYQKALALTPGFYKVDVVVRDVGSGNRGLRSLGFSGPKYDGTKLATSSLILTSTLRQAGQSEIGQRFVIANTKVIPSLTNSFRRGQKIGTYLQIYNAGVDQTTLRPEVDVEYVIMKDGKEVLRQKEDWSGLSDAGQRVTLARQLSTESLQPGEYAITIVTKDRVSGNVIENKDKFSILP